MSGGGGGSAAAAPVVMTQEEATKARLVKEKADLSPGLQVSPWFRNAFNVPEPINTDPKRTAEIDKEIAALDRTTAIKQTAGEGFQEISKADQSISTASVAFEEIGTEAVNSKTSKKKSNDPNLDAQRAALGARRRQSLFSTQNSRSLLG